MFYARLKNNETGKETSALYYDMRTTNKGRKGYIMKSYDIQFYNYNFGGVIWYKSETRDLETVCAKYGRYNSGDELTVWSGRRIISRAVYNVEKRDYIRVNVDPIESKL